MSFVWDSGRWDQAEWAGAPPPEPGWGGDWRWWYQYGTGYNQQIDLTGMLVEAQWSTDGHALGDGTFRGDIQPGQLTVRMWDPAHALDNLNKQGSVWAHYTPTNQTWCWFYESFTRGLVAPGDPAGADCVYVGSMWPPRLTTPVAYGVTGFPPQSVSARLAAILSALQAHAATLGLPPISGSFAAQSQVCGTYASDQYGYGPSYLQSLRDAAANGLAWVSATGAATGGGALVLNYARWETVNQRSLDRSQIIAGPAVTASASWIYTIAGFSAVNGSNGTTTTTSAGSNPGAYGLQGPTGMRLWGDVSASGPENAGAAATASRLLADRSNPSEQSLSSVDVQSGARTTPTGGISSAAWDPYAHVFAPTDVAAIIDDTSHVRRYRVIKSDHRLTSQVWQTTHTLEKHTDATPVP